MGTARRAVLPGPIADRWRIIRLLPHAGPVALTASIVNNVLLAAAPVVFILATSDLIGRLPAAVHDGTGSASFSRMVTAFVVAAAALATQQVLAQTQTTIGEVITRRIDTRVADELMASALGGTDLAALEDPQVLDQLSEASREVEQGFQSPGAACAGMVALIARYGQMAGCAALVGAAFSWWAGLGLLAAVLVFRHGQRGGLRRYSAVFPGVVAFWRRITYFRHLAATAPAAKEIRVFGLLDWLRDRHRQAYLEWMAPVWAERRRIYLKPYLWYTALGLAFLLLVLVLLGPAAADGRLDLVRLALVVQATLAAVRLGDFYPEADVQTQFGMNAYRAVREFGDMVQARSAPPAVADTAHHGTAATGDTPVPEPTGIRFEHVGFRYPGQRHPVFTRLDLTLPAGRCTAIVGLNGAGKTTLVKLLTRLATPHHGQITVGGRPLERIPVDSWRRAVAVVFQDYLRYESSAADNIAVGAVAHAHDQQGIREAAAAAGVLDVLDRLPHGLDTPLNRQLAGGVDLSGGQWQRVAIARALFALRHGASVLVLDEPTASLDVRAEARFFDEVMRATAGTTTVLISHRFATVRRADHIIVLADGGVAEQGTHAELMARRGRYARMFQLQAARFVELPDTDGEEPR